MTTPWSHLDGDPGETYRDTAAAAGQVPAEAAVQAMWDVLVRHGWFVEDSDDDRAVLRESLAAAAPLIVADRVDPRDYVKRERDVFANRVAQLTAEVDRLTAERDAYKELVNADYHFDERMGIITADEDPIDRVQRLTREVARLTAELAAVRKVYDDWRARNDSPLIDGAEIEAALGLTPGGPR